MKNLNRRTPEFISQPKLLISMQTMAKKMEAELLELYLSLFEAVSNIREKLFDAPQEDTEVAHYTCLHTLKSLADKERFRLYNAAYMNDPEEGRALFEIMKDQEIENAEEVFYGNNEKRTQLSPAYIGSFVKVNATERGQKDKTASVAHVW